MEIKIKDWKLGPLNLPPPRHSPGLRSQALRHVGLWQSFPRSPCQIPSEKLIGRPVGMRWTEGNLNRIFINFNTSTKQKQDSFIDLNIKITCAFFAFPEVIMFLIFHLD